MVNCWKEAVATGLQLAVFHALEAANDPDSSRRIWNSGSSLTVPNWRCRPLGDELLDMIRARSEEADVGSSEEAR